MPSIDLQPSIRQSSNVNHKLILLILLSLPLVSCGRYKARKELPKTRFFAEVAQREDRRWIGNDRFFEDNLKENGFPEGSKWCAIALGRIANPGSLPLLYNALHSGDTDVRAAAAFSIGEIEDRASLSERNLPLDPRAAHELIAGLGDPSLSVRMRAVEALGKIGSHAEAAGIVKELERFSYQGSPYERAYAGISIIALARLNDPIAVPVLERLADSTDPGIRWRALDALARLQSKSSAPLFVKNLQNPDSEVRAHAACGMGYVSDASQASLLFPLLPPRQKGQIGANPLPARTCALLSLGLMRNPTAVSAIGDAISAAAVDADHPDQLNFAVQAAIVLGNIGAKSSEAVLRPLLNLSGRVPDEAAGSLAIILRETPERFFELAGPYRSQGKITDLAWVQSMGELGGSEAVRELNQMLQRAMAARNSQAGEILPDILEALAKAGTPVSKELWSSLLSQRDCVVLPTAVEINDRLLPGVKNPWTPAVEAFKACNSSGNVRARLQILSTLKSRVREKEVQQLLFAGLKDPERNVRFVCESLLRGAGFANIPESADPAGGAVTDAMALALAATRKNSTIAQVITNRGTIEIELFREEAPFTAQNFVLMAKQGFYAGMELRRATPSRIEVNIPRTRLILGRLINGEANMRPFERGSIGMAAVGENSDPGGFFVALSPQPFMDGVNTCFGRVVSGMPIADRLVPGDRILKIHIKETVSFQDYQRY